MLCPSCEISSEEAVMVRNARSDRPHLFPFCVKTCVETFSPGGKTPIWNRRGCSSET